MKAAIKLLDTNNDGYIEFDEFVQWWQNKVNCCALRLSNLHAELSEMIFIPCIHGHHVR